MASNELDYEAESKEKAKAKAEQKKPAEESESNYDDEYDDTLPEEEEKKVEVDAVSCASLEQARV